MFLTLYISLLFSVTPADADYKKCIRHDPIHGVVDTCYPFVVACNGYYIKMPNTNKKYFETESEGRNFIKKLENKLKLTLGKVTPSNIEVKTLKKCEYVIL